MTQTNFFTDFCPVCQALISELSTMNYYCNNNESHYYFYDLGIVGSCKYERARFKIKHSKNSFTTVTINNHMKYKDFHIRINNEIESIYSSSTIIPIMTDLEQIQNFLLLL